MQVSPIATVGEAFDPRMHEALGTVDRDDVPDQHVAEEIRRGYRLRERLLRPAMVRVAHNPNRKANEDPNTSSEQSQITTRCWASRATLPIRN